MTVHGAKGLEAPIVFLPDTCTTAAAGSMGLLQLAGMELPEAIEGTPFVWSVKGTGGHARIAEARNELGAREAHERHRLLYVAMTRARDRLYVAGFEGAMGRRKGCWYELIVEQLHATLEEVPDGSGVLRRAEAQSVPPQKPKRTLIEEAAAAALPAWAQRPAPREATLAIPLAPSRLEAYAPDDAGEPLPSPPRAYEGDEPSVLSPAAMTSESRFLRGTLTHALLQHLPALPPASWEEAAKAFIAQRGAELSRRAREGIVKETLAILKAPAFAPLFGAQSRAEVPIVALLPNPRSKGPPLKLSGQIDRLIDLGNEVLIVDYKTNRPPPLQVERVAPAYLFQLAAYRLALSGIYPGRAIKAALLWTEGPRIMQVPSELLDHYALRLWDLDISHLDANGGHS
jgi:ATP-dependent helicase/nuclease subunit A